jgi:hypothetical protein
MGSAIAQASGFPPRKPTFELRSGHVGFVVDKEVQQVFSEYFGFSCHWFHWIVHTHQNHLSSGPDIIGQTLANVLSGLSLTPPQETKNKTNHWSYDPPTPKHQEYIYETKLVYNYPNFRHYPSSTQVCSPEDGDRIQSSKRRMKDRTIDNVQNCDSHINLPLSQTYR